MTHELPTAPPAADPLVSTPPPGGPPTVGTPPAAPDDDPPGVSLSGWGDVGGGATWPDIPGFRIERELGRGGMGAVYLAEQQSLGRKVAIKVIFGPLAPERIAALGREARTTALDIPGVVRVIDSGVVNGVPFLVLEYCSKGCLAKYVKEHGPVPAPQAAAWTAAVARVVAKLHAHEREIVHRDLKPANVLLAADGAVRVADLGIAKASYATVDGSTRTELVGTPAYMAPEQARGKAEKRSDVYSVGAILYALLTGRPPFEGETVMEVLTAVLMDPPVPPIERHPAVPPELNAICLKCLEKKPADRYQSAAELAEALEAWPASPHHERTVAAPRGAVTPPVRAASPRRRAVWPGRRGPLALAAGLVLAVGAVAAIEAARRADEYGRLDWERFNRVPTDGDRGWSDADGKNGRSDPLQTRLAAVAAAESHIARELRYAEQYLAAEPAALRPGGRERIEQYRTWLNDTMHEVRRARQGAIQGVDRALPPLPPAFAFHEWAVYVEPLGWEHGFGGANGMVNLEVQPGVWVKAFSAANYPRVAFPGRALIEPGSVRLVLRRPDQPDAVELKRFDAAALRDCHEMKATNGYIKTPQNPVTPCRHYDDVFDRVPVHDFTPGRKPVAVHSAAEKAFRESADYAPAAAAYKARMWATIYDFEYAWEFTDVRGLKFTLPHQNAAKWANWHPKMKPILNVTVPDGVGHDNNRPLEGAALQRHLRVPAGERAKPENWVDGVVR